MFMNSVDDRAKPKARSIRGVHTGENTNVRTWGLKRGKGVCSKEVCFFELMVVSQADA